MLTPLHIRTIPGVLRIDAPPPRARLDTEPPRTRVERVREPQVRWDRSDYRAAVNVLTSIELGRKLFSAARGDALGAIASIAQEGVALSRIENGGNPIAQIAQQKLVPDERELTLAAVPPPVASVADPGEVDIEVTPGSVRVDVQAQPVAIDWQSARVTVDKEVPTRLNLRV